MSSGGLVFVATPIGNLGDLSQRAEHALRQADVIACEDTRHTRKLLTHLEITGAELVAMHQHNEDAVAERLLEAVRHGKDVAVVSDAGMPGISDPGSRLARSALESGIEFDVIPGASAVLMAVVLSGFDTSRFVFEGFLPQKKKDLTQRCEQIAHERSTSVVFEAPHRAADTLDALAQHCEPTRRIALARELTKLHQEVIRGSLNEMIVQIHDEPPRGECVIVIEGAPPTHDEVSDDRILDALAERLARGLSTKDAVADVADRLTVPKRRVYALATDS